MNEIQRIRESSQYLATLLRRSPEFVEWLTEGRNLSRRYPLMELYQDLQRSIGKSSSFGEVLSAFRLFKQRHFLRIGGRDLVGWADLSETTAQLSDLASVALQVGLDVLSAHPEWWAGEDGKAGWERAREGFNLVVMGLGKLGGHELNYVSDVDLIFLYSLAEGVDTECPDIGEEGESGSACSEGLFLVSRLCQWLSRLLAEQVEGDRVFQVDLRLRPRGKDGALVPSVAAASDHYLHNGRPWERQMLLKARPVAGVRSLGTAFLKEVRPFVFRRFLDFQALDELRLMRDRILAEGVRPGPDWQQFDVKLGVGGIREIEFLVQSLQLIYGGRHTELDEPNTLRCLERLKSFKLLSSRVVEELRESYAFLRRVEHWAQLDQNRQTQKIPQSEEARKRLSLALGFGGDEKLFFEKLEDCCTIVHGHFMDLFHAGEGAGSLKSRAAKSEELMESAEPLDSRGSSGGEADFLQAFPPESMSRLQGHLGLFPPFVQETIFEVLKKFARPSCPEAAEKVLLRLERYFSRVIKRPGLMKVFHTSGVWLSDFCRGIARSELLSELLAHHPGLVEGIATVSGGCPDTKVWESTSMRLLERSDDYEGSLEWLRRLKNERFLQLILADLRGDYGPEDIERELSSLADFVIKNTYERVCRSLPVEPDLPLSVLGLGKLGSREMSYLSDLDLVFVYDPQPGEPRDKIPPDVIRLIQRFMRMLSTPLQEGPGYEVDARLRPTGNYGTLIVTLKTWQEYYAGQADLWEIQALLRLRAVAGNRELGLRIEELAQEICYQKRDPSAVWWRLCHLRGRMERERAEEKGDVIDLKLGQGGLADIEFLVQGHLLVEGYANPLLRNPSVRFALGDVAEWISGASNHSRDASSKSSGEAHIPSPGKPHGEINIATDVSVSFDAMRSLDHRLRLHTNLTSSRLTPARFESLQAIGLWPPATGKNPVETWQDLLRLRRRVRAVLQRWCPDL